MKLAIIGAGLAGLSCAYELEKHGIYPVIYEKDDYVGNTYNSVSTFLEIIHRPVRDTLRLLKDKYGISIKPINTVNTLIHHSPGRTAIIKGDLGYFANKGMGDDSIYHQIYSLLKGSAVIFNKECDSAGLAEKYDYVIVANGNSTITAHSGCWKEYLKGYVKGAEVIGDFDPNTLVMWINRDYCNAGYAYLAPYGNKKASLNLIVTNTTQNELERYWDLFIRTENIRYKASNEFIEVKSLGQASPVMAGNVLFTGNAGGAADLFLGFGQFDSIIMGVMAARAIAEDKDYNTLIRDIIRGNNCKYQLRKAMDKASNKDYDTLINFIGLPVINRLIYNTPINIIKYAGNTLSVLNTKIQIRY